MKLFFDTNLSNALPKILKDSYPNFTHAEFHELDEKDDIDIWQFCKKNNFVIVTKDKDFMDYSLLYSSPPKVILIRTGNCPTEIVEELLIKNYKVIQDLYESDKINCLFLHK